MTQRAWKNQKGFTLVELMMVVALFSLLMYAITNVLINGQGHVHALETKLTLETSARDGLTKIIEEVRESAPSRLLVGSSTLDFQVPTSVDSNGIITWSSTIQYYMSGTQLLRAVSGNTAVLANDVQNVSFLANDAGNPTVITIQMDMQREAIDGHMYSEALIGQAKIRNE